MPCRWLHRVSCKSLSSKPIKQSDEHDRISLCKQFTTMNLSCIKTLRILLMKFISEFVLLPTEQRKVTSIQVTSVKNTQTLRKKQILNSPKAMETHVQHMQAQTQYLSQRVRAIRLSISYTAQPCYCQRYVIVIYLFSLAHRRLRSAAI